MQKYNRKTNLWRIGTFVYCIALASYLLWFYVPEKVNPYDEYFRMLWGICIGLSVLGIVANVFSYIIKGRLNKGT
jgi:hypothetical protein